MSQLDPLSEASEFSRSTLRMFTRSSKLLMEWVRKWTPLPSTDPQYLCKGHDVSNAYATYFSARIRRMGSLELWESKIAIFSFNTRGNIEERECSDVHAGQPLLDAWDLGIHLFQDDTNDLIWGQLQNKADNAIPQPSEGTRAKTGLKYIKN